MDEYNLVDMLGDQEIRDFLASDLPDSLDISMLIAELEDPAEGQFDQNEHIPVVESVEFDPPKSEPGKKKKKRKKNKKGGKNEQQKGDSGAGDGVNEEEQQELMGQEEENGGKPEED